jgi:hypothetical protein
MFFTWSDWRQANLIGSAAGFNVRKLLGLLGTGIFSRALWVWGNFHRFLGSVGEVIVRICTLMFRALPTGRKQ